MPVLIFHSVNLSCQQGTSQQGPCPPCICPQMLDRLLPLSLYTTTHFSLLWQGVQAPGSRSFNRLNMSSPPTFHNTHRNTCDLFSRHSVFPLATPASFPPAAMEDTRPDQKAGDQQHLRWELEHQLLLHWLEALCCLKPLYLIWGWEIKLRDSPVLRSQVP